MDWSYSQLITEVQTTNELLEVQNDMLLNCRSFLIVICILLIVVLLREIF